MNKWMIWGFSHIFGNTHIRDQQINNHPESPLSSNFNQSGPAPKEHTIESTVKIFQEILNVP